MEILTIPGGVAKPGARRLVKRFVNCETLNREQGCKPWPNLTAESDRQE